MTQFSAGDRKPFTVDVRCGLELTNATAELIIDGQAHPITWDTAATKPADQWIRRGHTDYFAGPDIPTNQISGATVLARGPHRQQLRVIVGTVQLTRELVTLRVR